MNIDRGPGVLRATEEADLWNAADALLKAAEDYLYVEKASGDVVAARLIKLGRSLGRTEVLLWPPETLLSRDKHEK